MNKFNNNDPKTFISSEQNFVLFLCLFFKNWYWIICILSNLVLPLDNKTGSCSASFDIFKFVWLFELNWIEIQNWLIRKAVWLRPIDLYYKNYFMKKIRLLDSQTFWRFLFLKNWSVSFADDWLLWRLVYFHLEMLC